MIPRTLFLSMAFAISSLAQAKAGLITYTESADVFGTLGQQGIGGLLTVSLTADTSGITQLGAYHYTSSVTTATVTVDGLTATFLDPVYVFSGNRFAGFTDNGFNSSTILDVFNGSFSTYNLATPIGPLTGLSGGLGGPSRTTLGTLEFMTEGFNGTFTATAQPVPEPSSFAMLGVGLAGVASLSQARRARG